MKSRLMMAAAVALIAVPLRAEEKPDVTPPELAWVPANCAAFVHVRFADLWDSPAGKAIRDAIAKSDSRAIASLEQAFGVRLAQIDRLTILVPEVPGRREPGVALRVTTTEPYDVKQLLTALRVDEDEAPNPGQKLFRVRGTGIVHLTGPKDLTMVFEREGALGLLGKLLEKPASGGLSPALAAAAQKHALVAGVDIAQFRHIPGDEIPPPVKPLIDAQLAILTGDLKADTAELALTLRFGRAGHADDGAKALTALKEEALKALAQATRELGNEKEAAGQVKLIGLLSAAIKSAKIETKETQVAATMSLKTDEPLAVLAAEGMNLVKFATARTQSQNNLKQIGLAMHNYHDTYGYLPPAAICDASGRPLLSWRVAILPYVEQDNLYKQFKLDEPWDSEHNKKLIAQMPKIYALPRDTAKHEMPSTYYRVFVGNGAMFEQKRGVKFSEITDGLSNTGMVVEAADAAVWTKPDELNYDPQQAPKLGFHFGDRANVLFGDGSVRAVRKTLPQSTLHWLIQRADGNNVVID